MSHQIFCAATPDTLIYRKIGKCGVVHVKHIPKSAKLIEKNISRHGVIPRSKGKVLGISSEI